MGLEEVLTSVKKVPKSSRKRQNSQSTGSGGRKGGRMNESLRDEQLDMLQTSWFDEKVNGDDDMRRMGDKKSVEKPKSRKKSDSKAEKGAGNGKASRRSRSESENMMQFGFPLDAIKDIRPNGGVGSRGEQVADSRRHRDARSSFEQVWNQELFANRPDFRMDPLLSPSSNFGARFELEQGSSGDTRKSVSATLDKQVGDEKAGRTRCRRRSDVKRNAVKMGLEVEKPEALMANMAAEAGHSSAAANLPNHKVSFVICIIYIVWLWYVFWNWYLLKNSGTMLHIRDFFTLFSSVSCSLYFTVVFSIVVELKVLCLFILTVPQCRFDCSIIFDILNSHADCNSIWHNCLQNVFIY